MRSVDEVLVALQEVEAEYTRVCLSISEWNKQIELYKHKSKLIESEFNLINSEIIRLITEEEHSIFKVKQQLKLGK